MAERSVSETVEFRGGPDDGTILVAPPGHVFEIRYAYAEGAVYLYEETGRLTNGGHREAAYRGEAALP